MERRSEVGAERILDVVSVVEGAMEVRAWLVDVWSHLQSWQGAASGRAQV